MEQRNSHWRVQSFISHPQAIKNGSAPGPTFPGKFDENNIAVTPTLLVGTQSEVEPEPSRDVACKAVERQATIPIHVQSDDLVAHPLQQHVSDAQLAEFPVTNETMDQQEELTIEGGTISISSVYSQGWVQSFSSF